MVYAVAYGITAILTALVCWVWHSVRLMETTHLYIRATKTIEYLIERTKPLNEAVALLDKQRHHALYPMDDQLITQKQVAEFIERWK